MENFNLFALCIAPMACVLIISALVYAIRKIAGIRQGHDQAFFAREAQDYIFGKPPDKYERRAMRANSRTRR